MASKPVNQAKQRRFHIAFAVNDIAASVVEYNAKLGCEPEVLVRSEYALWRTETLNVSIRCTDEAPGFRHVGWEDSEAPASTESVDGNGIVWEHFSANQQLAEIEALWPAVINDRVLD